MYKILIVDDEDLERKALRAIINKGIDSIIEIQEAVNGRESIAKSRSFIPDIIFLDIKMPGIDGIEAAKIIKQTNPAISIIFLTAFNQFDYAHEAIQIGVDDFIIKPSPEKRVLEVITKLITSIDKRKSEMNRKENNELKLSRATGYLENEFIYKLSISGITEEKFENYLSILEVNFFRARAGIIKLIFDTYPIQVNSNYQKQVLKKRCAFILRSSLREKGIITFFNIDFSNIHFLLIVNENKKNSLDNNLITSLILEIEMVIQTTINMKIMIGLGSVFTHYSKSLLSFTEAKNNLREPSAEYTTSLHKETDKTKHFPLKLEIEMERAISGGNRNRVLEIFQKIGEWFVLSNLGFEEKKRNIVELVTVLKHTAAYQSPDGECLIDYKDIQDASKPIDILSSLNIFLHNLLEAINKIHEIENSPVIEQACEFINTNYQKDISLEETASYCRLSSFYFSKLFKKKKKITFIDYLTNKRIAEAEQLLLKTNLSIKEISINVGYNDPNYFTRVFKRIHSVSPTVFRNNKILIQQ